MAKRPPERSEKAQLVAEIESARLALGDDIRSLSKIAEVPTRIREHLLSTPVKVAAGSALASLAASLLLRRPAREADTAAAADSPFAPLIKQAVEFAKTRLEEEQSAGAETPFARFADAFLRALK